MLPSCLSYLQVVLETYIYPVLIPSWRSFNATTIASLLKPKLISTLNRARQVHDINKATVMDERIITCQSGVPPETYPNFH
jgi:hypothetical protein